MTNLTDCCSLCSNASISWALFSTVENVSDTANPGINVSVDFRSRVAFGIIFVTLTSLSSLGGAIILPLLHPRIYRFAMVFLVGVAVGTLAGSGLLHLLPVALKIQKIHDHEVHKDLVLKMLTVFAGIYLFFLAESFFKSSAAIWKRLRRSNPRNSFELDHDLHDVEGGKRKKISSAKSEALPHVVHDANDDDSIFIISHKVFR